MSQAKGVRRNREIGDTRVPPPGSLSCGRELPSAKAHGLTKDRKWTVCLEGRSGLPRIRAKPQTLPPLEGFLL